MDIENLIERLMKLTYRDKSNRYYFSVISEEHKDSVSNEIKSWADEQNMGQKMLDICRRLAELEAKVFTYESIIKNSNFAPILESKEKEK